MRDYDSIVINKLEFEYSNWKSLLSTSLPERLPYEKKQQTLQVSTMTGRIIGIPEDELSFFKDLHEAASLPGVYFLNDIIEEVEPKRGEVIQRAVNPERKMTVLSMKRLIVRLKEEQLIPRHANPVFEKLLEQSLLQVLELMKQHSSSVSSRSDFNKLVADFLDYVHTFLVPWLKKENPEEKAPKIIWYGEAPDSVLFFLYYAMLSGLDVLIFNPGGTDPFAAIDPGEEVSFVLWLPQELKKQALKKPVVSRSETVAYRSSKELDNVLQREGASIYKPWQFKEFLPLALTLKTTYDELFLIAKEKAFVRPEFSAKQGIVRIPNVFAHVIGITDNKKEYWNRIHTLMDDEQARVIRSFPFSEEERLDYTVYYREVSDWEGNIDPERLKVSAVWLYKHLPAATQTAIAAAISRLCKKAVLLPAPGEGEEDVRLYLFTQATNLSEEGLKWIQVFDYAQDVPKLLLYYTESSGILSRADAAKLLLLNELGFDIIIYNPPGYTCIEQYIDREAYDTHMLDEIVFNQKFKSPSIFKKTFGG